MRQRETGKVILQLQSHIKYDRCCDLKTNQHSRSLQIHIPILYFLFLSAFLSITQYVPQAVNWRTASLFCHPGTCLAWLCHALFSFSSSTSEGVVVQSRNVVFSFLFVEIFPLLLLQGLLLNFFFAKAPIVFKVPHVYTLCNYSSPSSIAFTCLYL